MKTFQTFCPNPHGLALEQLIEQARTRPVVSDDPDAPVDTDFAGAIAAKPGVELRSQAPMPWAHASAFVQDDLAQNAADGPVFAVEVAGERGVAGVMFYGAVAL